MRESSLVSAKQILTTTLKLRRVGIRRSLQALEEQEPELAAYMMESLSSVYARVFQLAGPERSSRHLYKEIQFLVLVSVSAIRDAGYEQWRRSLAGTPLGRLADEMEDGPMSAATLPSADIQSAPAGSRPASSPQTDGATDARLSSDREVRSE